MHISFLFSVIFLIFLLVFGFSSLFFLYTQIHLFRVILGIFIGMLILDQTSARFTEEQTNERANKKKQQHYIEKNTNDAASLYKLSIVGSLSDCCPIIYRIFWMDVFILFCGLVQRAHFENR